MYDPEESARAELTLLPPRVAKTTVAPTTGAPVMPSTTLPRTDWLLTGDGIAKRNSEPSATADTQGGRQIGPTRFGDLKRSTPRSTPSRFLQLPLVTTS